MTRSNQTMNDEDIIVCRKCGAMVGTHRDNSMLYATYWHTDTITDEAGRERIVDSRLKKLYFCTECRDVTLGKDFCSNS